MDLRISRKYRNRSIDVERGHSFAQVHSSNNNNSTAKRNCTANLYFESNNTVPSCSWCYFRKCRRNEEFSWILYFILCTQWRQNSTMKMSLLNIISNTSSSVYTPIKVLISKFTCNSLHKMGVHSFEYMCANTKVVAGGNWKLNFLSLLCERLSV